MQITAPTHPAAVSSRQLGKDTVIRLRGHKQRMPVHLPWQLNAAITAFIALGIAVCVLVQL